MNSMTINGISAALPDDRDALLVDVVRDTLNLTGTKLVCGSGVCGACTVLLDGVPVASCLLPAQAAAGKAVTTVEGVSAAGLHPVQKAFMAHDALQCGFCTPGFVVEAVAFHDRWRAENGTAAPSREQIGAALSGHLCRCGAYDGIFNAVAAACAGQFDGRDVQPPRIEAQAKVTGAAKYTVDIRHDGQLEGVILRSNLPHAKISRLDLSAALALPGVAAAIPLLGDDNVVRFVGAPIAAVAARDRNTALAAIAAIGFSSEALPAVVGLDAARQAGAPVVFDKSSRRKAGNTRPSCAPNRRSAHRPTDRAPARRPSADPATSSRSPRSMKGGSPPWRGCERSWSCACDGSGADGRPGQAGPPPVSCCRILPAT